MPTENIKISELDIFPSSVVNPADFLPMVQSSSMTTYRVNSSTLLQSASYATSASHALWADTSSFAITASKAISSSVALTASYFNFPPIQNVPSSSWASSSISSSYTLSASLALLALSASYALSASSALTSNSSSFAAQSLSASYAVSASNFPIVDTLPVGSIMAFAGPVVPNNWLECDGRALLTASFSSLYNTISQSVANINASYGYLCDSFGNRNALGLYFKIPDLRGEFVRGWDDGKGLDTGRVLTSAQLDAVKDHTHNMSWVDVPNVASGNVHDCVQAFPGGTTGTMTTGGGTETRPVNVAMIYCIKYSGAVNFAQAGATLAGDVTGVTSNTLVTAIQNVSVAVGLPTNGQVLQYNGTSTKWTPQSLPPTTGAGKTYIIANPAAAFMSSSTMYVFQYNRYSSYRNLFTINTADNSVVYKLQWPEAAFYTFARPFRSTADGYLHALIYSDVNAHKYVMQGPSENSISTLTGLGAFYDDLPISASWVDADHPTIWTLFSNFYADSTLAFSLRESTWGGASYTINTNAGAGYIALDQVVNSANFKLFDNYASAPGAGSNVIMWDYNYILKRFYLVDTSTALLHIFNYTGPGIDLPGGWSNSNVAYVKTVAIPAPPADVWYDVRGDKWTVDYDPDSGTERGIIVIRRGATNLNGTITYINWPEL